MPGLSIQQLANAFKALSNPHRLQMYQEILSRQQHQVGPEDHSGCLLFDFINSMNIGAPTISHHVKELVNAQLITVERNGKFLTCFLNPEMRDAMQAFLAGDTELKASKN